MSHCRKHHAFRCSSTATRCPRRSQRPASRHARDVNAFWQNASLHNYADYAMSEDFRHALVLARPAKAAPAHRASLHEYDRCSDLGDLQIRIATSTFGADKKNQERQVQLEGSELVNLVLSFVHPSKPPKTR